MFKKQSMKFLTGLIWPSERRICTWNSPEKPVNFTNDLSKNIPRIFSAGF